VLEEGVLVPVQVLVVDWALELVLEQVAAQVLEYVPKQAEKEEPEQVTEGVVRGQTIPFQAQVHSYEFQPLGDDVDVEQSVDGTNLLLALDHED
jgi:hypothetical protein